MKEVTICRRSNVLYYSINGGNLVALQDLSSMNFFDTTVTFGASIDSNGNPFRFLKGTLKNLYVKLYEPEQGNITEYEKCKYIESTGTQYIYTNINAKQHSNLIVEIEGNYTRTSTSSSQQYIFGSGFSNNGNGSWILLGNTELGFIGQKGINESHKKIKDADTEKHLFKLDMIEKKGIVDSDIVDLDDSNIVEINSNYSLFALNGDGKIKNTACFRMYSCKIIEDNKLIRDFEPCLDNNGVACLYDKVTKHFYRNAGTGTFNYELK